jgi:urease accessory protein
LNRDEQNGSIMSGKHLSILKSLQHGDSFFPAGGIAMSGGLETLVDEHRINSVQMVEDFLTGQLQCRWATMERPIVVAASRTCTDLEVLCEIDAQVEAQTLAAELRGGSVRSGRALLQVHSSLDTNNAEEFREMIQKDRAIGHNMVVQGLVWGNVGLSEHLIEAMSAHTFCVGLLGASLRLGVIGHTNAQAVFGRLHEMISGTLKEASIPLEGVSAFSPEQEIAVMRHENSTHRLFFN